MSNKYTPGEVVTVGDLEVGDTVFLRQRTTVGQPVPTHPATVTALEPTSDGRVAVSVRSANAADTSARLLGSLPVAREFRRVVITPDPPVEP